MSLRSSLAFLVALLVGCGGNPTVPLVTAKFPSALGTWNVTLTTQGTFHDLGVPITIACPGTMIVSSQTGGQFAGTYQMRAPCPEDGSLSGETDASGGVKNLSVTAAPGTPDLCQHVSGDPFFSGSLTGNSLALHRARTAACGGTLVDQDQVITGTRGS
jgi:hypothetical protein